MKIILYVVIALLLFILISLLGLSASSRKQADLGLVNGKLRACPAKPNCVCSEFQDKPSSIEPLVYSIAHADAWHGIKEVVVDLGGEIVVEKDVYLRVRFVTPLLRFIDDVELRHVEEHNQIHIRSASRVGRSDFGVNRKRVERLRQAFNQL